MTTQSLVPSRFAAESGAARVDRVVVVGVMNASAMYATSSSSTDENRRHGSIVNTTVSGCDTTRIYESQALFLLERRCFAAQTVSWDLENAALEARLATSSSSVARHPNAITS